MLEFLKKLCFKWLDVVIFLLYYVLGVILTTVVVSLCVLGKFDLLSIPVVIFNGVMNGIDKRMIAFFAVLLLCVSLCWSKGIFWVFNKFHKEVNRSIPLVVLVSYVIFLFGCGVYVCREMMDREMLFHLYLFMVGVIVCIIGRDFRPCNKVFLAILLYGVVLFVVSNRSDFYMLNYDDYFVEDTRVLKMDKKRNVIVVFAESFEKRFSEIKDGDEVLKVIEEGSVRFSNFYEGYHQEMTISALHAFLEGVYPGKGNDYKKYFEGKKAVDGLKNGENAGVIDLNNVGVSNVLKHNGYVNLFVKGASINFLQTDKLLYKMGFDEKNIYDVKSFLWWNEFLKKQKKFWWGPSDEHVFSLFKEKILEIEKDKPFFAVMFTCDLHDNLTNFYDNPFFETDEEIVRATINNLNDFIEWFKGQEFYENTTLIILADHKKMGKNAKGPYEKLFNAFYNLPKELVENINLERSFNQVDMAPSVLEIAGVKLSQRRYGVGVSLFSPQKTIVERKLQ